MFCVDLWELILQLRKYWVFFSIFVDSRYRELVELVISKINKTRNLSDYNCAALKGIVYCQASRRKQQKENI